MSKLSRVTQNPFGTSGPVGDFGAFGSKAANPSAPIFTQSPVTIQSLPEFEYGWGEAIIGDYEPPIEDMNGLFLLIFYQLCYLFQEGIAEYDVSTEYFINSLSQQNGLIYQSLIDNNLGNTPSSSSASWRPLGINTYGGSVASGSSITLPNTGNVFTVTGTTGINNISIQPAGTIVFLLFSDVVVIGTSGNLVLTNGSFTTIVNATLTLVSNGTNWYELTRSPVGGILKAYTRPSYATVYQALTDGFIVGYGTNSGGSQYIEALIDPGSSPSDVIQQGASQTTGYNGTITCPVSKGWYWEVQASFGGGNLFWIPMGS